FLKAYIQNMAATDPEARLWNVAVITGNETQMSERPLGPDGRVACVTRNPLKNSGELAFVKAIMSRGDVLADVEAIPGFYPEITDGCKRAENFWSCLATL